MKPQHYKNIKNGKTYTLLNNDVINCTNKDDGKIMALYTCEDSKDKLFVREMDEFLLKFEKMSS
jgi:hypothetical protein